MRTLTVAIVIAASTLLALHARGEQGAEERRAVLVELFTSEGCSSCPPAEALLPELDRAVSEVEVIPLAFHVDYWNYLGWKDRFSSADYSSRQRHYAKVLGSSVFTPQLIVDGVGNVVGSDRRGVIREIRRAAAKQKGELAITIRRNARDDAETVSVEILGEAPDEIGEGEADVLFAVAEDGLVSEILRGENAGERLHEEAVVRELLPLGSLDRHRRVSRSFELGLQPEWKQSRLRYVAFIQTRDTRAVIAVAQRRHPAR